MWFTGALIFAFAAPGLVTSLREAQSGQDKENFQLLIPLVIPNELELGDDTVESSEDSARDRDEPYSSIPAFAFTLDSPPVHPRAVNPSYTQPAIKLKPSHSLYLGNRQQPQDTGVKHRSYKNNDSRSERLRERRRDGCKALAEQFGVESRAVLLYLCTELVEVLSVRCECCEENRKKKTRASSAFPMPWFGPVGNRRHASDENVPNEAPRQQITV